MWKKNSSTVWLEFEQQMFPKQTKLDSSSFVLLLCIMTHHCLLLVCTYHFFYGGAVMRFVILEILFHFPRGINKTHLEWGKMLCQIGLFWIIPQGGAIKFHSAPHWFTKNLFFVRVDFPNQLSTHYQNYWFQSQEWTFTLK